MDHMGYSLAEMLLEDLQHSASIRRPLEMNMMICQTLMLCKWKVFENGRYSLKRSMITLADY
ncbi:hypothetical protein AB205_0145080 [Aquarana catesbeiana]|uniref:Uncharacterized protein n=1 Tax=Aquarana catesbeiana TaxID=8400 RepID=A0A2G9SAK7_AQUCT|nr:hypothetical protein AB205_0145080 [Aquarana catesbeiana]